MAPLTQNEAYIRSLVAELNSAVDGPVSLDGTNKAAALQVARKLTEALDAPGDAMIQDILMIAIDLDLFNVLVKAKDVPQRAAGLATISGAEPLLIMRIMRVLTAMGYAKEVGKTTYSWTAKTELMTTPTRAAGWKHVFMMALQSTLKLPDFFKSNGYKNPTNVTMTPFQFAYDSNAPMFEWMQQRPAVVDNFNTMMKGNRGDRPHWVDWFPIQEQALDEAKDDPQAVLIVDIGGGKGHDVMAFRKKFPDAIGRVILQDQQHVLNSVIGVCGSVEAWTHDFFTPQPIKGARIYFTHYILHDWDDEKCILILKNTAAAMTKGYSKLYLNEWILPDVGCSLYEATIDIQMMLLPAGIERTQSQWRELLQLAGLKLERFWAAPGSGEGIIEALL